MPFIEANGERLHYLMEGSGPAVLLIHSMGVDAAMWREQFKTLAGRYTCIAFDCRGHGDSSYNARFTVADVAADHKAGLDELGISACHVVGLAMGGPVALSFAAQWPDAVRSLVIADGFADMRELGGPRIPEWSETIRATPMAEFGRNYAQSRLMKWAPAGAHDEMAQAIAKVPPEAYIDVMKAIFEIDFLSELATIQTPTLVLWGENDEVTPFEHSRQIADGIPGAVLKTVPDAGHIANIDQPEAFNRHLAEFLDNQPS
jgi:pimeloyl-ACP methyl ester carboxylesterase